MPHKETRCPACGCEHSQAAPIETFEHPFQYEDVPLDIEEIKAVAKSRVWLEMQRMYRNALYSLNVKLRDPKLAHREQDMTIARIDAIEGFLSLLKQLMDNPAEASEQRAKDESAIRRELEEMDYGREE